MSDQATDAREACIEAIAQTMYDARMSISMDHCVGVASDAAARIFAPSRVPCPTCGGRLYRLRQSQPMEPWVEPAPPYKEPIHCTNPDCSDGTVEGPSLAEQALGFERVWVPKGVTTPRPIAAADMPVYRRRSSESAP